jgi:hypothetical protein
MLQLAKHVHSKFQLSSLYTLIIFLTRNGRIRAVKFRLQNFGRMSFNLGEISPEQQILRLNNGRNSPRSEEIRPKFLWANLNCANSPVSGEKNNKISTVCPDGLRIFLTFFQENFRVFQKNS